MSGFHRHYAGRFVFYVPVGGAWGYLCEDFIMRFLTSYFNVHMTYSTNLNIALCCTGVGLAIGLVVAIVVENKMNNYRYTLEKKQYVLRRIVEVLILLIVIILTVICLKIHYTKYHDFLYPTE